MLTMSGISHFNLLAIPLFAWLTYVVTDGADHITCSVLPIFGASFTIVGIASLLSFSWCIVKIVNGLTIVPEQSLFSITSDDDQSTPHQEEGIKVVRYSQHSVQEAWNNIYAPGLSIFFILYSIQSSCILGNVLFCLSYLVRIHQHILWG